MVIFTKQILLAYSSVSPYFSMHYGICDGIVSTLAGPVSARFYKP